MPKISRQECIEGVKHSTEERLSDRSEAAEVPKMLRQRCIEVVKNATQERISERSNAIEVSKTLHRGMPSSSKSLRSMFLNGGRLSMCPGSRAGEVPRSSKESLRSEFLDGQTEQGVLKYPKSPAGKVSR